MILVLEYPDRGEGMAPCGGLTAGLPQDSAFKESLQANLSLRVTENGFWSIMKTINLRPT